MSSNQRRLSSWGGSRQFMQGAMTCGKNPKVHSAVCLQEPRNNKISTRRVLVVLRIWKKVTDLFSKKIARSPFFYFLALSRWIAIF
ncbi:MULTISPECIES: hypothetical protein [unclassified Pseudomonas]|uniref:hypothetical protein n=1 Tax=unclassified Pseudomonas TaxID=196821 RepID=UPI0011AF945F|nr:MULTISPECIES: hypothetical protein [unclassified Pseudomonas]